MYTLITIHTLLGHLQTSFTMPVIHTPAATLSAIHQHLTNTHSTTWTFTPAILLTTKHIYKLIAPSSSIQHITGLYIASYRVFGVIMPVARWAGTRCNMSALHSPGPGITHPWLYQQLSTNSYTKCHDSAKHPGTSRSLQKGRRALYRWLVLFSIESFV